MHKQVRHIIDSETANEVDDQAAIAYALLSPTFVVRGLVAVHLLTGDDNEYFFDRHRPYGPAPG